MKVRITSSTLLKNKVGQICLVHMKDDMGAYVWMPSGNKVYLYIHEYEEM